jgi:phage replication-related protein YjqB (UPF0714/DUF867 family)
VDLRELLALPGVKEECILRSEVGIMALHGGAQDRGTDLIARQVAERSGSSYYAIIQTGVRVHLTSRHHDPDHSPLLRRFLNHVEIAISVHGFGRDGFELWLDGALRPVFSLYGPPLRGTQTGPLRGIILGGRNPELLGVARAVFAAHLDAYQVADERLRLGFHAQNPVNLPRQHGVQIELPPGLRGIGPLGERPIPDPDDIPDALLSGLTELAAEAHRIASDPPSASRSRPEAPRPHPERETDQHRYRHRHGTRW